MAGEQSSEQGSAQFYFGQSVDLFNPSGREATNEALWGFYRHLTETLACVNGLKNQMIADISEWQAYVERQLDELRQDIPDRDVEL